MLTKNILFPIDIESTQRRFVQMISPSLHIQSLHSSVNDSPLTKTKFASSYTLIKIFEITKLSHYN